MRKTIFGAMVLMVLLAAGAARADIDRFRGRWINTDADTRGITKVAVRVRGSNIRVRVFGQCHPQDCDWGAVRARAYGSDVSSDALATARVVTAQFRKSFARRLLILRIGRRGRLRVRVLTHFTDGSGRNDTVYTYTFERARTRERTRTPDGRGNHHADRPAKEDPLRLMLELFLRGAE